MNLFDSHSHLNDEKFDNDISIRFSMNNLIKDGKIINIPLFLIEYMENFIQF